jgi:hypothetical protein
MAWLLPVALAEAAVRAAARSRCCAPAVPTHEAMDAVLRFAPDGTSLGSVLYVEASHLALSKTENVSDRLVFKPVRLPLERFAFEIADGLPDFCDDRAIRSSMKAHRFDVWTDDGPLARPVLAYCFAPMNVATIHTVGTDDIIGEHGPHAVNVPCVKAIVDAHEEFDITVHWFSPWHGALRGSSLSSGALAVAACATSCKRRSGLFADQGKLFFEQTDLGRKKSSLARAICVTMAS